MKTFSAIPRLRAVVAASLLSPLAGTGAWAAALMVPPSLAPAVHETLRLSIGARGVQIYECRKAGDGAAWAFVAPEAELFDTSGRRVGTHARGPQWRFDDGSHVTGRVRESTGAPQPDAIPWLLLDAHARWPYDRLSSVSSIQRLNTRGGQPPATGCEPGLVGRAARVPYSADYHFYARR